MVVSTLAYLFGNLNKLSPSKGVACIVRVIVQAQ